MLALYLFGGEVLEGFAFTMLVGIITEHLLDDVHRVGGRDPAEPGRMRLGTAGAAADQGNVGVEARAARRAS